MTGGEFPPRCLTGVESRYSSNWVSDYVVGIRLNGSGGREPGKIQARYPGLIPCTLCTTDKDFLVRDVPHQPIRLVSRKVW